MSDAVGAVAGDRLLSFVERVFHIDDEIKSLNEGKKEILAEAKSNGFDLKVLREVMRIMRRDKDERDEHESLLNVYLRAIESAKRPKEVPKAA